MKAIFYIVLLASLMRVILLIATLPNTSAISVALAYGLYRAMGNSIRIEFSMEGNAWQRFLRSSNIYVGMSNFEKWYYWHTRNSIFDPIKDRLELIPVLTAPRKVWPHGYEKSPTHEVPSSNLGTPTKWLPQFGSHFVFFRFTAGNNPKRFASNKCASKAC